MRRFLDHTTLTYLSFCNPLALTLGERLSWYRPGRERLRAVGSRLLPRPHERVQCRPRLARSYLLPMSYLAYGGAQAEGLLRRLLALPRRPWLRREQGGR